MIWGGIGYHSRTPLVHITENMWPMVAQRLTQIKPSAATPDNLWQSVEAAWSAVLQELIQSLCGSIPRQMAAVNGGYSGY
ncbi:transposable element Tcb1 transposase [Trichonephila clavipes]|uniref:Transposable element Tcb1 transposase n=1 Tax=Trichonephila clavipes TaxID=2585209 RepID=A0A8X6SAQ4_TRICX|nr:transposable element Tcb1 transposase [Trichonephila clavipes]